jgi:hypothetical protein
MKLFKRCGEWFSKARITDLPTGIRGIYALLNKHGENFDVVYIGMAHGNRGIKGRLEAHDRSKRKGPKWTHFSLFEVWEAFDQQEIRELEGLLHEIYRKDSMAMKLVKQRRSKDFQSKSMRCRDLTAWRRST